jgi:hypothetical protein
MNTPIIEQLYVTSLEEIVCGGLLVAITMAMHGFGMLSVVRVNGALMHRSQTNPTLMKGMLVLVLTSWMILLVHLLEVLAWAGFFWWKAAINSAHPNWSLCYYFALNEYTTLGSNYNLILRWRLLEGAISMAGLLTFAWSTGVLLTVAQEFQEQQLELIKQRRTTRPAQHHPGSPPPTAQPHYIWRHK